MEIRRFRGDDAAAVAGTVERCLRDVNSRDYPAEVIEQLCAHYAPARVAVLAGEREMFVADDDGRIVGTVSRDGNQVYTMFVDPRTAGTGVGRRLMGHVEGLAAAEGFDQMEAGASITAYGFYRRLGYLDVRTSETELGLLYVVRKPLR